MSAKRAATRRHLLVALAATASALTASSVSFAQAPAKVPRIGVLSPLSPSDVEPLHQAFRLGLRERGWVEGKNVSIEYRYAEGRSERLPDLAADLVRLKVDVIVTSFTTDALAAQKSTKAIPIVVAATGDPVASGLVESLARPGGNITGLSQMSIDLAGKRLGLLKEMVPKLSRVAVLWNPQGSASTLNWKEIQIPAQQLGVELHSLEVRSPDDFDRAFEGATRAQVGALFIAGNPLIAANLKRIADFAARNRLPAIYQWSEFADFGGLMSYGADRADLFRRAANYVDKILKGTKPGDLPIDRAIRFELVVNMKTARALGITVPQTLMIQATRVIE